MTGLYAYVEREEPPGGLRLLGVRQGRRDRRPSLCADRGILFCILWFAIGWGENALTAALSILAITLTQMVLNSQYAREAEASRRDIALHAKLDELIIASKEARNEIAGVEELEIEEIEALKEGAVVTPLAAARKAKR